MHLNVLYNFTIGTTYIRHIVCPPFRLLSWGVEVFSAKMSEAQQP
uniref:Uncharacterized protein n=1 Tax=Anguilla anguilla TaxID=7936 RepID=A0A0E9TQU5_ANGAN